MAKLQVVLFCCVLVLAVGPSIEGDTARASLISDSVSFNRFIGAQQQGSTQTNVVGSGIEFFDVRSSADLGDSSIRMDFMGVGYAVDTFFLFSDLDWVGMPDGFITGVSVTFGGDIWEIDPSRTDPFGESNVSFTDHTVSIDAGGLRFEADSFIDIQLQTEHAVPEPTSLLVWCALGAVAMTGRRVLRTKRRSG